MVEQSDLPAVAVRGAGSALTSKPGVSARSPPSTVSPEAPGRSWRADSLVVAVRRARRSHIGPEPRGNDPQQRPAATTRDAGRRAKDPTRTARRQIRGGGAACRVMQRHAESRHTATPRFKFLSRRRRAAPPVGRAASLSPSVRLPVERRRLCRARPDFRERATIVHPPVLHHHPQRIRVADRLKRVAVQHNKIGQFPCLNRPEILPQSDRLMVTSSTFVAPQRFVSASSVEACIEDRQHLVKHFCRGPP